MLDMAIMDETITVRSCNIPSRHRGLNRHLPFDQEAEPESVMFHVSVVEFITENMEDVIKEDRSVYLLRSKLPALLSRTRQILHGRTNPDTLAMLRTMVVCMIHVLHEWGKVTSQANNDLIL